jgi:hypothetical protein
MYSVYPHELFFFLIFSYKLLKFQKKNLIFLGDPGPWLGLFHSKYGSAVGPE